MSLALALLLACGRPSGDAPSATPADEAPPPADAPAAEPEGERPVPDDEGVRTPSDLVGIDPSAAEDAAAAGVAAAMYAALDAEDARAAVDLMAVALKEEEGPAMFQNFGEGGVQIDATAPRYLGQRDGAHHYLGEITVTEPAAEGAAPTTQALRFHVQVGKADGEQWKVLGLNGWSAEDEAAAAKRAAEPPAAEPPAAEPPAAEPPAAEPPAAAPAPSP